MAKTAKLLKRTSERQTDRLRKKIARGMIGPDQLAELAHKHPCPRLRYVAIMQPNIPQNCLRELASRRDDWSPIIRNPFTPPDVLDRIVAAAECDGSGGWWWDMIAEKSAAASADTLHKISTSPRPHTRYNVAEHPNTSDETLLLLAMDPVSGVRETASERLKRQQRNRSVQTARI